MNVRTELEHARANAERNGERLKDPYVVVDRLTEMYGSLAPADRIQAARVFAEWLLSNDSDHWHLALILIGQLRITTAVPELRLLAAKFRTSREPGSPMWLETVEELVGKLTTTS